MTLSPALQPLAAYRRWVNWVAIPDPNRPGKTIKRPVDVRTGLYCKAKDPAHQYSYAEAAATGRPSSMKRTAFGFLDMDGCLEPDGAGGFRWNALANDLCAQLTGAAIEASQSGTGLHAIGRGAVPAHSCKNILAGLELYTHDRFVALTGRGTIGNAAADLSAPITAIAQRWFPPNARGDTAGWTDAPCEGWGGPEDGAELLRAALASGKKSAAAAFGGGHVTFEDLWNANADALGRKWPSASGPYDASQADAALASHLAYWTGKNCERIRDLMWGSALVREKWVDRPDWLDTTILRASGVVSEVASRKPAIERRHATGNWEEPDLSILDGPQILAPPFPRAVLGSDWAPWCERAAEGANAPYDYPATALLAIAAALIGNARVIAPSESWTEPALLWVALVGGPSAGKSPALDPMAKVITALEADLAISFESIDHAHQSAVQIAKAHCAQWEKETQHAIKDGLEPPSKPLEAIEPNPPARPRIFLSDTTMEAAADIAAGNPKGVLLYRDELAGWWRSFNRYSGGDGERQFWLQAYSARTHTVDRKKAGKPIIVPRLSISALGGVQPEVLATMLNGEADGFAARFLFAFPEPTAGFTLAPAAADIAGASIALRRLYDLALMDDGNSQPHPFVCSIDRRAAASFEEWWRAKKRVANDAIGLWGNWLGKQGGTALRIALVLEHFWWSTPVNNAYSADSYPREISEKAIKAATELIDNWAGPMAQRAFGAAAASPEETDAAALARWLRSHGKPMFNSREVRRTGNGPGGRLANAASMNTACATLEAAGIVRRVGIRADGKAGRAPSDYEVNPLLHS